MYTRQLYCNAFRIHCSVFSLLILVFYINSMAIYAESNASRNTRINFTTKNVNKISKQTSKPFENSKIDSGSKSFGQTGHNLPHSIFFIDTFLKEKTEHTFGKEALELLNWLDIDPAPSNLLIRLKKLKKTSKENPEKILDLFKINLPSNPISFRESKEAENEISGDTKKSKMVGIHNSSSTQEKVEQPSLGINDSVSLDPSVSLKRDRRQADEDEEPPHWPGAPQGARRQYLSTDNVKQKVLSMMLQALYSAQERLWPMGAIISKYEHLTPYRMAFLFLKLDQLAHESHSIFMYLHRQRTDASMTITRRLQLYSHLVRRNVDITYLVDYIKERVPRDQVTRIRQAVIRFEQNKIMNQHLLYGKTTTELLQRPWN